ncbi:hypothetical protein ACJ41O_006276 [Fusarium nematophilum]
MLVTMEGGLLWRDVYYKHLQDKRNIIIGGQCPTVGVSGFTLGGGLSPFSHSYKLGYNSLLKMTVVTYDAKVIKLSPDDKDQGKRDLFWAMTGGVGGNFGVALTGGTTVIYNGGWVAAQEVLKPLLTFGPTKNGLEETKWTGWVRKSKGWDPKSKVYHHHASFIFSEGAITPAVTSKILDLVHKAAELLGITAENGPNDPKCHILWDHIGAKKEEIAPEGTAFFWRQGHYVSTVKMQWTDATKSREIMEFISECKTVLLPFAIEHKAVYVNYIDGTVPNWQESYYGHNYTRLQKVKTQWDPNNFLWNWQSIKLLEDGARPLPIHDVLAVPSKKEVLQLPQVKKVEKWWEDHASLVTPDQLGEPETEQEAYERDAELRRDLLRGHVL